MKKLFLLATAAVMMVISACTKDNTCVKQIAEEINLGYAQSQAINDGTLKIEEIPSGEFFNWPNGNVFENEKIFAIIEANKDYTLTDEDKEILTNAIQQFIKPSDGNLETDDTNIMADNAKDAIRSSKTLKDLFAHGSTF